MALSRRGIELPASMLVILIISIVTLGLASGLTYKLVCSAEDQLSSFNDQQEREIERRLLSGAAVIIPDATKAAERPSSLCGGSSVPGAVYALGIRNDNVAETAFVIDCAYKGVYATGVGGGSCDKVQFWPTAEIALSERAVLAISTNVDPSMEVGRHVYSLRIHSEPTGETDKKVSFYLDVQ